nr:hypothetical protein [Angustibacter aerolatus]
MTPSPSLRQEGGGAQADDRQRDDRSPPHRASAQHRPHLLAGPRLLAHAVDALDADGRLPLALGAGRPLAPLTADVGDPVGVTRADRLGLLRRGLRHGAPSVPGTTG